MSDAVPSPAVPTRRGLLASACLIGVATTATACADRGNAATGPAPAAASAEPSMEPSPKASSGGGTVLGKTTDIPVGGGKVFTDARVVVTQPTAGDFQAFSAVCTHMQCLVSKVGHGTINCPCHGSKFKVTTGAVAAGPARAPLSRMRIVVTGDDIVLVSH